MNSAEILRAMLSAGWVRVTPQTFVIDIRHSRLMPSRGILRDEGPADFADNIRRLGEDLAYHGLLFVTMASYFKFTVRHEQQPMKFRADRHNRISVFKLRAGFWCHSFSDSQAVYNARSR